MLKNVQCAVHGQHIDGSASMSVDSKLQQETTHLAWALGRLTWRMYHDSLHSRIERQEASFSLEQWRSEASLLSFITWHLLDYLLGAVGRRRR
jgi:hypothetical protein